jgi:hypothetical protein
MTDPELVFTFARGQNAFFRELAAALIFEVERLGGRGRAVVDDFPPQVEGSVTVLLPPHEYVSLTELDLSPAVLSRAILISAEQPTSSFFAANVALAHRAGAVLDINRRAVRTYQGAGVPAEHLQLGYSEAWDRREDVPERDIDVLFIGRATPRRELALARYADVLDRLNCEFILSDNRTPNSEEGLNFVAGENKLRLLARSKVLLNIHGEGEPYFEWLRAAEAMSSGCVVVTENSTDMEPLRPGVDLITGSYESLGLLTAWMADDHERRAQVAREAELRLRAAAPLKNAAATLLAVARRVNETPVTPQAEADVRVAKARISIGRVTPVIPPSEEEDISPGEQRALRALKRQQQELLGLRRRLARYELRHSRPESPAPETVKVAASRGRDARSRPLVSVIVPLHNDAEVVGEALDSVLRSTLRSWEIVVVDDASTDGSGAAVSAWMDEHPDQRASLVRHEVNRGLSAARNTGAKEARGSLLLMLDSDNLLRPFGLARLTEALRKDPGADFAYGILDRFQRHDAHGIISKFAWEPGRLREDNYIDAFSLIRRRALFELGGYSEDGRLALGLEDYDLWARMAELRRRGAFVRQFVGSYRVGHSSMLSVTGISSVDAFAAIAEHAPTLMRGAKVPN